LFEKKKKSLQQITMFLLVEGLASMLMLLTIQGGDGC
jgi:hypothetical protein